MAANRENTGETDAGSLFGTCGVSPDDESEKQLCPMPVDQGVVEAYVRGKLKAAHMEDVDFLIAHYREWAAAEAYEVLRLLKQEQRHDSPENEVAEIQ